MAKKSTMTAHVHKDDVSDSAQQQELAASIHGSARKPQIDELVETIEIDDDLDRVSDDHQNDDQPTRAVVARGRTVDAPVPKKRRLVGQTNDGVQIYGPVMRRYGHGEVVELAAWEVRRLQELGFLVDPSKIEPAIRDNESGPTAVQDNTHSYFRSTTR